MKDTTVKVDVLADQLELREGVRSGGIELGAELVADRLVMKLSGDLEAIADGAPNLDQFLDREVIAAEESEGDEFRVGGVRSLDEGGDGTGIAFVNTLTEVELSAVGEVAL